MKAVALLAALLLAGAAGAQEPPPAPPPEAAPESEPEAGVEPEAAPPSAEEILAEIQELIEKVRQGFLQVDRRLEELQDAAALAVRPEDVGEEPEPPPPLEEGLAGAVAEADRLLADMEELLAKLPASDSPSGGGGGQESPRKEGRNLPAPGQEKKEAEEPKDGQEAKDQPEEREGSRPPLQALNQLLSELSPGAWGSLPVRLQEALQNASAEELPPRYRRWIERYHRRPMDASSRR